MFVCMLFLMRDERRKEERSKQGQTKKRQSNTAHPRCMYVCVSWGHLDVWGKLASHKRSLTHCPSSQDWASRCP